MMAQIMRRISNSLRGCRARTGSSGRASGPAMGGCWTTGGGYLQITVITSSHSISRPGWNRTTMSFLKTLVFCWEKYCSENWKLSEENQPERCRSLSEECRSWPSPLLFQQSYRRSFCLSERRQFRKTSAGRPARCACSPRHS